MTTVGAVFGGVTEEQLKEVARIGRIQSWEPTDVVFREGDAGDTLYVILGGALKVYRTDKQDQEIQLATLKRGGDYFGELALIDGEPRSAGVSTIAPCQFFLIGRRDFLTLVSKSPGMLAELLVGLSTTIRRSSERVSG